MSNEIQQTYRADDIKILEGLEAVRKRPGMYIGSTGKSGLNHLVFEVVDNSIDEAMAGYCSQISVHISKENVVTVKDNGRGIPIDIHQEKGIPAVEIVMTTLHAGGKFEGKGYKVSGGLHGVGVSVVNALSEWLDVEIHRDNKLYTQRYHRGNPEKPSGNQKKCSNHPTGTLVRFYPDHEIFEDIYFTHETIQNRLKELAFLNKGIEISFIDDRVDEDNVEKIYKFDGGIASYVDSINESKSIMFEPIYLKSSRDFYEVEVAFQYISDYYDENVISFANNIRTREGGTHLSGFRSALTRVINSYAKRHNLIKDRKVSFLGQDLREGLTAVISIKLPNPQFEGQTKTKLGNSEVKGIVDSLVDRGLSEYLDSNIKIGKLIIEKALLAQRLREATKKAQELVKRKSSLESTTLPGKLADCSEKDPSLCELYIVEGDSAGGSAKQARDRNNQAILPLRGKVLNVEKARLDKILANEEIRNLITAIGPNAVAAMKEDTENNVKSENTDFDVLSFLRYHRIIIMTDADVDGAHIRTLLLTLFFRYGKAIIESGCLYIAQPPLFLAKKRTKKTYLYSDQELENYIEKFGKDNLELQRYKGLGEMNADQLWETTMNPNNRRMLQVTVDDTAEADRIFSILMGSDVSPRKNFIERFAKDVRWIDT